MTASKQASKKRAGNSSAEIDFCLFFFYSLSELLLLSFVHGLTLLSEPQSNSSLMFAFESIRYKLADDKINGEALANGLPQRRLK